MIIDGEWSLSDWVILLTGVLTVLYLLGTWNHNHFKKRNIPYVKPLPFFGNMRPAICSKNKEHFPDYILRMYRQLEDHPYGGVFSFMQPVIILRDPELIQRVTVKDFDHFTDHRSFFDEATEPLWDERWRNMRSILNPAFTSSKTEAMFGLVSQCCQQMVEFLEQCYQQPPEQGCFIQRDFEMLVLELKELYARYTNDVIARTAFGIEIDSFKNPTNEFYMMGQKAFKIGHLRMMKYFGYLISPKLMQLLGVNIIPKKVTDFLRSTIYETVLTREKEDIVKPDMLQLLTQAMKGVLTDETSSEERKKTDKSNEMDMDDIGAQALMFFLAGFETTSTLLCFASHQLAVHPDIQNKLQEEIDATLQQHGGKITHEAVHSMKYLDMVVSETLRMFPPSVVADRLCVKPYCLEADPPVELKPGDTMFIPIYGLHHDPEHYSNPERFDPERFSDEKRQNINPFAYLPFGSGPRSCIGKLFALMESKLALAYLLSRFNLSVVPKTPMPLKIIQTGFNISVKGGFWFGLQPRNS
ncbi:cytochrome P450 9e2 isoform X2 [Cryptotermes secundus]|uniref:cytochrome P450 9e2 isoform X2 n=1 Tax=Cryptotermes secundus TaxID=105785 RepID=UPI000CD7D3F1|nr:cytochrome P450 9e2 isoform X2 [Cryptotermes secundus]